MRLMRARGNQPHELPAAKFQSERDICFDWRTCACVCVRALARVHECVRVLCVMHIQHGYSCLMYALLGGCAGNLLIDRCGTLKLGDFGLARPFGSPQQHQYTPGAFTRWYRPPELLLSCYLYGEGADMWSVACIIAEMYQRQPLFTSETDIGQVRASLRLCLCLCLCLCLRFCMEPTLHFRCFSRQVCAWLSLLCLPRPAHVHMLKHHCADGADMFLFTHRSMPSCSKWGRRTRGSMHGSCPTGGAQEQDKRTCN